MAPPNRKHQEIIGEIFGNIGEYLKRKDGTCKPYITPFAVFLNADDRNYIEPDISAICDKMNCMTKAAAESPIGLLKWFLLAAAVWITTRNSLNTVPQRFVNIGLLIQPKTLSWFIILKKKISSNLPFPIL